VFDAVEDNVVLDAVDNVDTLRNGLDTGVLNVGFRNKLDTGVLNVGFLNGLDTGVLNVGFLNGLDTGVLLLVAALEDNVVLCDELDIKDVLL
jgi:hypothetical protein